MISKKTTILSFLLFILLVFSPISADYPNLSDYPSFLTPDLYIIVGVEGSATDVLASTEIATGIKGELPNINVETRLDRDVVNPYGINKNFLLIGSSCTNRLIALIMGKTYPSCGSESDILENSAIIKIYNGFTYGYNVLTVSGWSDSYTRMAASVLKKHNQFLSDKFVKTVKVTFESSSGVTPYDEGLTSTTASTFSTTPSIITTSIGTSTVFITTTTIENRNNDPFSRENTAIGISTTTSIDQKTEKPNSIDNLIPLVVIIGLVIFLTLAIILMRLFKKV